MSEFIPAFWVDRTDRERQHIDGPDRAKFLHNLCTNEIKNLKSGRGCEMFVTSPQGKTLGYLTVFASEDHLTLRADPGSLGLVLPHFAKYSVFDDVSISDVREKTFEVHIAGSAAEEWRKSSSLSTPETGDLNHILATWRDNSLQIINESPFGIEGFTLIGPIELRTEMIASFKTFDPLSAEDAEGLRIETGTPRFGVDILPENLPQEIGRDARTISFVKGCYLGQETVARLDALGHVNKLLRGIRVESRDILPPGTEVFANDKPAGILTSSGHSPRSGQRVAIGMLKVKAAPIGQVVTWLNGNGVVSDFPIS